MPTATVVDLSTLPIMLSTHHLQELTGLSMPMVYALLNRKGCPVVRFGRAIRVLRDPFLRWLEEQAGVEEELVAAK
jgi:excisionase family DNA binding protein